ncbi:MAG: RNA polymerase sigma factor [Carbonactinosporaceae bacterium]
MGGEPALGREAEMELVQALRARDEAAFMRLVDARSPGMLRVALAFVPSHAVAEEVVQETWLALLEGIDRFEGRASLKTWLFRVLVNIAKTRGGRERRTVPFSALTGAAGEDTDPTVDAAGHLPQRWDGAPEAVLQTREVLHRLREAISALPQRQRAVVELRDVAGLPADDVCRMLGLTQGNQRVLLHRGRAHVRQALADYLGAA